MTLNYNIFLCVGHTNACIASTYHKVCWTFELLLLSIHTLAILQCSVFENIFKILIVTWKFNGAELWMISNIWSIIIFYKVVEAGFYKPLIMDGLSQNTIPLECLYWFCFLVCHNVSILHSLIQLFLLGI